MSKDRSFKQTYFGRVISPARYHEGKNGKPFISFTLFLSKYAINRASGERVSGKIGCSYQLLNDKDPVGFILCRIFNKDNPELGGLAGQAYKSVELILEGTERLTEVVDAEGNPISGAYYKNLDYCTVQITDKEILNLYKSHMDSGNTEQDDSEEVEDISPPKKSFSKNINNAPEVEQPNRAPSSRPAQVEERPKQSRKSYEVGDIATGKDGKAYRYVGGILSNTKSWELVEEVTEEENVPPTKQPVNQKQVATPVTKQEKVENNRLRKEEASVETVQSAPSKRRSIQDLLQEDGSDDGSNPLLTQVSKNLAV